MNQNERRMLLLQGLMEEEPRYRGMDIPDEEKDQELLLRGLMNIRPPREIDKELLEVQDAYLSEETRRKGVTDVEVLTPIRDALYLWQGDITCLACDAIVNAANSGMTGCYVPNHRCIDNCIHTYAGMQLRLDCAKLMDEQGYAEPTGRAKITRAYNLPCKYILHTVGPIITGKPTRREEQLLASCYRSCLALAAKYELESVAFCCISTGEFHFPNELAARIAIRTVTECLAQKTSVKKVIFNVFKDTDLEIYRRLLTD